jgi:hypothetical protein
MTMPVIKSPLWVRILVWIIGGGVVLPLAFLATLAIIGEVQHARVHDRCMRAALNGYSYDETREQVEAEIARCR